MKKIVYTLFFAIISVSAYAQSWEPLSEDFIYDIANYENTLYTVGYHINDDVVEFVFASSEDSGNTWEKVILNQYLNTDAIPITVDFFNANKGIIGIIDRGTTNHGEYLETSDGGLTWHSYSFNLDENCYLPIPWNFEAVNESMGIINREQNGGFLITRDGGQTWDCNNNFTVAWLPHFTVINESLFYTFDENALYKSSDSALTWAIALEIDGYHISTYSMNNEMEGCALAEVIDSIGSIYILSTTIDGWSTKKDIPLPMFQDLWIPCIASIGQNEVFIFQAKEIYYSSDSGHSFSYVQTLDFEPTQVIKIRNDWYATGRGLAKYNPDGIVAGINDPSGQENVIIFPNPITNSIINLNTNEFNNYQLFSLNSTLIEDGSINGGLIELQPTRTGIYILVVKSLDGDNYKSFKIIVK